MSSICEIKNIKEVLLPVCESFDFIGKNKIENYIIAFSHEKNYQENLSLYGSCDLIVQNLFKKYLFEKIIETSESSDQLFDTATKIASINPFLAIKYFNKLDNLNTQQKFQILLTIAEKESFLIFKNIQQPFYSTIVQSDPKNEWKLVKILVKKNPRKLVEQIQQFQSLDNEKKYKLIEIIATTKMILAFNCPIFKELSSLQQFEVIQQCIEKDPKQICGSFNKFKNLDPDHRYALILQLIAKGCSSQILSSFEDFGEFDLPHLCEIIRNLFDEAPRMVISQFNKFKSLDPKAVLELVMCFIDKGQLTTILKSFKNFDLLISNELVQAFVNLDPKVETTIWENIHHLNQEQIFYFLKQQLEKHCAEAFLECCVDNISISEKLFLLIKKWIEVDPINILSHFQIVNRFDSIQKREIIYAIVQQFTLNESLFQEIGSNNFSDFKKVAQETCEEISLFSLACRKLLADSFDSAKLIKQLSLLSQEKYQDPAHCVADVLGIVANDRTIQTDSLKFLIAEDLLSYNLQLIENLKQLPRKLITPFLIGYNLLRSDNQLATEWKKSIDKGKYFLKDSAHRKILTSTLQIIFNTQHSENYSEHITLKAQLVELLYFIPLIKPRKTEKSSTAISKSDWNQLINEHAEKYIQKLHLIHCLISLGKSKKIIALYRARAGIHDVNISNLEILLKSTLRSFFGSTIYNETFERKFLDLVYNTRVGPAYYTLIGILNQIHDSYIKREALDIYRESIIALIRGRFARWRSQTTHLNILQDLGHQKLVDQWTTRRKEKPLVIDNPKYKNYQLVVSNEFSDLMLFGRDTGGCLSIDGGCNASYILGMIGDGKVLIYGIKDPKGRLIARYLSTLLIDRSNNKPIILLGEYFSLNGNNNLKKTLLEFVIEDAKELHTTLISYSDPLLLDLLYPEKVHSYSTKGSLEYADIFRLLQNSDEAAQTDGAYTLPENSCHILFAPGS